MMTPSLTLCKIEDASPPTTIVLGGGGDKKDESSGVTTLVFEDQPPQIEPMSSLLPRIKILEEVNESETDSNVATPITKSKSPPKKKGVLQRAATAHLDHVKNDLSPDTVYSPRTRKLLTEDEKKIKEEIGQTTKLIEVLELICSYADKPGDLKCKDHSNQYFTHDISSDSMAYERTFEKKREIEMNEEIKKLVNEFTELLKVFPIAL